MGPDAHGFVVARRPQRTTVDFDEWLLNVHDVFMNAQLMRTLMDAEPLDGDGPEEFMVSRRGRLERCAMRDMYVLIEAYKNSPAAYLVELARLVPAEHDVVERLLRDADRVANLRDVRDYMSHRDLRRYYDAGRLAVAHVGIQWHRTLETAFATMLLMGIRLARVEREAGTPAPAVSQEGPPTDRPGDLR